MVRTPTRLLAAVWLALCAPTVAPAQMLYGEPSEITGHAVALAGDLIRISGAELALYGIDAPELDQTCWTSRGAAYPCGAFAQTALDTLLGTEPITCWSYGPGSASEEVGRCFRGSVDIGELMILRGWARAQLGLSHRYVDAESIAQTRRAGIWSGTSEAPWVWRARR